MSGTLHAEQNWHPGTGASRKFNDEANAASVLASLLSGSGSSPTKSPQLAAKKRPRRKLNINPGPPPILRRRSSGGRTNSLFSVGSLERMDSSSMGNLVGSLDLELNTAPSLEYNFEKSSFSAEPKTSGGLSSLFNGGAGTPRLSLGLSTPGAGGPPTGLSTADMGPDSYRERNLFSPGMPSPGMPADSTPPATTDEGDGAGLYTSKHEEEDEETDEEDETEEQESPSQSSSGGEGKRKGSGQKGTHQKTTSLGHKKDAKEKQVNANAASIKKESKNDWEAADFSDRPPSPPKKKINDMVDEQNQVIRSYTREEMKVKIAKWREKKKNRTYGKKVRYKVRKEFADNRRRVGGRFVAKTEEERKQQEEKKRKEKLEKKRLKEEKKAAKRREEELKKQRKKLQRQEARENKRRSAQQEKRENKRQKTM